MDIEWKTLKFPASAEKCAKEIDSIGESATPQQILDFARKPETELHKCFEWDDTLAAEKYRLHQARQIVCNLVFVEKTDKPEPQTFRILQKADNGYKPIKMIVQQKDEYARLLERARAELRGFKIRYKHLAEFEEIFALID